MQNDIVPDMIDEFPALPPDLLTAFGATREQLGRLAEATHVVVVRAEYRPGWPPAHEWAARAVAAAVHTQLPSGLTALNIGSGRVSTIGDVATALTEAVDGPAPVVTGEFRLGDVRHVTADSSAARRVLGWRAEIELRDGVRDLL